MKGISLKWDIVNNIAGEGANKYFFSDLTIMNSGREELKNCGWKLYFNFIRLIYSQGDDKKIFDDAGLKISKFSGALYSLEPTDSFKPLSEGESVTIRLKSSDWAILKGDSIMGAHIHYDGDKKAQAVNIEVGEFYKEEHTKRFFGDNLPVETPNIRFKENSNNLYSGNINLDEVIIPRPNEFAELHGTINVAKIEQVSIPNDLEYLLDIGIVKLEKAIKNNSDSNFIRVVIDNKLKDNCYTIEAKSDNNSLELIGGSDKALFYGLITVSQVFEYTDTNIECFKITDMPLFEYRGVMLDIARHFQTKETLLKVLDLMAYFKLNKLHLHFCDDEGWRIENKNLPELTTYGAFRGFDPQEEKMLNIVFGSGSGPDSDSDNISGKEKIPNTFCNFMGLGSGYYSEEDFLEILKYANERFIEIIPEIDVPGHFRAAIKAMEHRYKKTGDTKFRLVEPEDESQYMSVQLYTDNVLNPCLDSTYDFLTEVVSGVNDLYKRAGLELKMLHLGGDEVPHGVWEKSPVCQKYIKENNLENSRELISIFFKKLIGIVHSIGDAVVTGWEDIAIKNGKVDEDLKVTGFVPMPWSNVYGWGGETNAYKFANKGFNVILASATNLYMDLAYSKDPEEIGYYWAHFVDTKKAFYYRPYDFYKSMLDDRMGNVIDQNAFKDMEHLNESGKSNILGLQGLLFGENSKSSRIIEYQMFPKLIGVAERAWNYNMPDLDSMEDEWSLFCRVVGQYTMPLLDDLDVHYRIPEPGAIIKNGKLLMNSRYPGLTLEYSIDGGSSWINYDDDNRPEITGGVVVRSANKTGERYSRESEVKK